MQTATVVAMLLAFFSVGAAPATAPATRPAAETLGFEQVMAQTAYEKIMADAVGAIADFDLDPTQKEQLFAAEKAHQDNLAAMRKRHDVKAIEADDFDRLVAPVYARGFIKLYAECVGLDPMPLQKQFDVSSRAAPALAPSPSKALPRKQGKVGGRSKASAALPGAAAAPPLISVKEPSQRPR